MLVSSNIYAAAERGTLRDVRGEMLTEKALTSVDPDKGYAPIHIAAMFGHLDQIPKERLTPAVMSAPSLDKLNALHYAAREHHLDQVPKRLLTPELLGDTTHGDWTPAHEIAACGDIGLVPKSALTEEVLTKSANTRKRSLHEPREPAQPVREALTRPEMSVVEICIRNGSMSAIPRSALTRNVMNANTCSRKATAMHIVAENGCWDSVPANFVTERTARLRDANGETPLHYAANSGKLSEVPERLFTPASVMQPDDWGDTPLHRAALSGYISQMPSEFLTRKNLSVPDRMNLGGGSGKTSYHYAASSGTLGDLPSDALERSDLLRKDKSGWTPLHDAAFVRRLDKVPRGMVQPEDLDVANERGLTVETAALTYGCLDHAQDIINDSRGLGVVSLHSLPADPQTLTSSPTLAWVFRDFQR
jgi:ankyrin repeat protein